MLREFKAKIAHDIWSHWMKYMFSILTRNPDGSLTIPPDKVLQWRRQFSTEYDDLSEKEKDSDREIADNFLDGLSF